MAKFAFGVLETGGKFSAGVVDTGGNYAAGVVNTGSSLGRYVFGSEISYNKAPPRLPGLGC